MDLPLKNAEAGERTQCSMWMFHCRYEATSHFIGLIWRGRAIIGIDLAPWGWGVVAGKFWAGWYREDE